MKKQYTRIVGAGGLAACFTLIALELSAASTVRWRQNGLGCRPRTSPICVEKFNSDRGVELQATSGSFSCIIDCPLPTGKELVSLPLDPFDDHDIDKLRTSVEASWSGGGTRFYNASLTAVDPSSMNACLCDSDDHTYTATLQQFTFDLKYDGDGGTGDDCGSCSSIGNAEVPGSWVLTSSLIVAPDSTAEVVRLNVQDVSSATDDHPCSNGPVCAP